MHRIDGPGATVDNQFTIGNPATNTPATTITPDWANDVQGNLCRIIEGAGLSLVKGDFDQVLAAVKALSRPGMRNKIINGAFDIWQRGTSLAVNSGNNKYLADRWRLTVAGASAATTYSRQAFAPGQADVPFCPRYFARVAITNGGDATAGQVTLRQGIESVRTLAGGKATLTFWAKADAAKTVAVEISQNFGTGGSPSAEVVTFMGKVNLTTTWQKFTIPVTVPSIIGKTIGSNGEETSQLLLSLWMSAGSNFAAKTGTLGVQTGTFDFAQVQFEAGADTDFETRFPAFELALCERYYEVIGDFGPYYGAAVGGTTQYRAVRFRCEKRVTGYTATDIGSQYYQNSSGVAIPTKTWTNNDKNMTMIQASGMTSFNGFAGLAATVDAEF